MAARSTATAIELLVAAIFRIGEALYRIVGHPDRMTFEPHPACDLLA